MFSAMEKSATASRDYVLVQRRQYQSETTTQMHLHLSIPQTTSNDVDVIFFANCFTTARSPRYYQQAHAHAIIEKCVNRNCTDGQKMWMCVGCGIRESDRHYKIALALNTPTVHNRHKRAHAATASYRKTKRLAYSHFRICDEIN